MNILVLHSDKQVLEMISFSLESKFHFKVNEIDQLKGAIRFLKNTKAVDLIIYEDQDETPDEFKQFLAANIKAPRIVLTKQKRKRIDQKVVAEVDVSDVVENLYASIEDLIKAGKLALPESDDEFCRIRTSLLVEASPLKGNIYIRLSKDHYVKLFQEGASFDRDDFEKYAKKKKQEYLYLKKIETGEFVQKYQEILAKMLAKPVNKNSAASMQIDVIETVQELSSKIGFTPEVKELTKQNVQLAVKTMGSSPKLKDVLKRYKSEKGKYIASHSMILAEVACALAKNMSWTSEGTYYKLTMAAFLHDMTLKNEQLAAVRTMEELGKAKSQFTEKELEEYKNHPAEAANIVKTFTEVPPDVDTIIFQHHERPDGSGFPKKLTGTYISQLSAVFIIAHEIVQSGIEKNLSFEETLRDLREIYTTGNFKRILSSI